MEAKLKSQSEINREEWDAFIGASPQGMFYALSGYMDIIAPGWQGIEVRVGGKLLAVMPVQVRKKAGISVSLQPPFAQFWGIFLTEKAHSSAYKEYSYKRKLGLAIVAAIPDSWKRVAYNFSPEFDYALPFHWAGYKLQARYTYQLDLSPGLAGMEASFGDTTRQSLRKAEALDLVWEESGHPEALLELIQINHQTGKQLIPSGHAGTLKAVAQFLLNHKLGFILTARDPDGRALAAGLFGTFRGTTVYLSSANLPALSKEGIMTLLLWKAMQKAASGSNIFDFEGSMMEGIEAFFRGFSPRPRIYLHIQKNKLPLLVKWITRSQ